ncbi:uncharacterized protein LOC129594507 [Paramacrobiotus metropolitanus]|uniref:uncharacterized protein LOC129594507 n=1 Tax=Paramacrobiotus metropolitanus TaxID=2943436 RepID=UPI002445CA91|nr:uncharacterized protein LOC129594507 [Paramacrobiotus metropolitanus]
MGKMPAIILLAIGILVTQTEAQPYVASPYNSSVYYPPQPNYGRPCGFPNVVPPPAERLRPENLHGLWYSYRSMVSPVPHTTINEKFYVHKIKSTVVPLTDIPAEYQWRVASQYHCEPTSPTCNCSYWFWVGSVGQDAGQRGDLSLSRADYNATPWNTVVVAADYNKYFIEYGCTDPNFATGICGRPLITINTRIRPSKFSAYDRQELDRIFNAVFARYCITADAIGLQTYDDAKPDCDIPEPAGCVAVTIDTLALLNEPIYPNRQY